MGRLPFSTQKIFFAACLSSLSLLANASVESTLSTEKTLHVKRISEYWKDGDYKRAKIQIIQFLETTPNSPYHDHLNAMLGDLCFLEGNYTDAINSYKNVKGQDIQDKVFKNLVQSHFYLKEYDVVIQKVEQKDPHALPAEVRYLYAESLFQKINSGSEEEKTKWISSAKEQYSQLQHSEFKIRAYAVLAQLHKMTGNSKEASSLYEELITLSPNQKENLLMEKASQEMLYDPASAIKSFEEVCKLNGPLAPKAAFNQLVLLFEQGNYQELIDKKAEFESIISSEKASLINLLVARSYYALENYTTAIQYIDAYFENSHRQQNQDKAALLTFLSSAEKIKDLDLFERGMKQFAEHFSSDADLENIFLAHAQLCMQADNIEGMKNDITFFQNHFASSSKLESLLFDYALLLSKKERWEDSRAAFLSFVESFPKSVQKTDALEESTRCCLEMIKKENLLATQKLLVKDLLSLLEQGEGLSLEKRDQYSAFLLQNLLDLKEYPIIISYLETYFENYPQTSSKPDFLFFLAVSYLESGQKDLFIPNAEHILKISENFSEKEFLHKQLYNLYIEKGDDYFQNKAAEHLYSCYEAQSSGISVENKIWLATRLLSQSKNENSPANLEKVHNIYQDLLYIGDAINVTGNPALEEEVIKFVEVLDLEGNLTKKLKVLEDLHACYNEAQTSWKWKKVALLELASSYRTMEENAKAIEVYDELIQDAGQVPSYHGSLAVLEKCKLQSKIMEPVNINDENPQVSEILDNLKDLQIKKKLNSEPVHLEAALDYVDMRVLLATPDTKKKQAIFFLQRIKEDFSSMEATDYLLSLEKFPEQALMYHAYMDFVDMQIDFMQASIAKETLDEKAAEDLHAKAKEKLGKLLIQKDALPKYLQNRISETQQIL